MALVFNGISHVVMMATPIDLEDFAIGFSLTEGIIESPSDILDVEATRAGSGIELRIEMVQRRLAGLKERRRTLTGRTGCGLCGTESLDAAIRPLTPVVSDLRVSPDFLLGALPQLDAAQDLRRATRGAHGAGWLTAQGMALARQDVGRHNALDKVIGAAAKAGLAGAEAVLVVSSRCSSEMVQKAVAARVSILAAVAAPTTLAVKLAAQWGLTLVATLRTDGFDVLTHPERVE